MSDVVAVTVATVNLLKPGHRRGRPYRGDASADEVEECLTTGGQQARSNVPDDAEMAELRAHADRLYSVFALVEAGDMDSACTTLNALMADTHAMPVLARHGGQPWHLHFHAPESAWATSWGAGMATSLAVVLGSSSAERLGICSAAQCDRAFADTSRNGTRRFCSTSCQNRMKAAAFRARRTSEPR